MLSIGKVGGGQASPSYYVEHVAQGAEDYYAGKGEARGRWHGKGAEGRGLSGPVADDDFLTLLTADPPWARLATCGRDRTSTCTGARSRRALQSSLSRWPGSTAPRS